MSGKKHLAQAAKARRARVIKVAPVTHAVRLALAATTLALAGTGAAYAGTCSTSGSTTQCDGSFVDTIAFPDTVDLTLVVGGSAPTSVTPADGDAGIDVAGDGAISISSFADITTYGADGIHAYSSGSLGVTNDSSVYTYVTGPGQEGIDASAHGDVDVTNTGRVVAYDYSAYDVTAVRAESVGCGCTATVENTASGSIFAYSYAGSAIGVYGYASDGTVHVGNDGSIEASSNSGLADGVFAAGVDVGVRNGGTIQAVGYSWAAAIEAEGSDVVSVKNGGALYAYANGYGGHAFGIYAAGGTEGATVVNGGMIRAVGPYATGIDASALGDVTVSNTGDIDVGDSYWTAYATGIHAGSNGEGSLVSVANDGFVGAYGYFSATGIEVVATGAGGSASVGNTGTIYAGTSNTNPYSQYGSAVGIVVSADGDAHIDNSGSIQVSQAAYGGGVPLFTGEGFQPNYGGTAYGAMALSFNGDASVSNAGDIHVAADPFGYAVGVLAASQNGNAGVANSGLVESYGKYAYGLLATSSAGDVTVGNDAAGVVRALSLNGMPYAFAAALGGIATQGDATIDNAGYALAVGYGTAIGAFGIAGQGDVTETNSGEIVSVAYGTAIGMFARADYGTASATNTGSVTAYAYAGTGNAVGLFARSDYGTASATNGGDIIAVGYGGTASGILSRGATADASNSGSIDAYAYQSAYGIEAVGTDLATIHNDGDVLASSSTATAIGALGISTAGDVSLSGTGSVAADGPQAAIGLYGYAPAGMVTVRNDGSVYAASAYGIADGIFVAGHDVDVGSTGSVVANGYGWAAGIEAHGYTASIDNSGSLQAIARDGAAYGVYAYGPTSVGVANSGSIQASGRTAMGIFAGGGDVTVDNTGEITVGDAYTGNATGILVAATGDGTITNGGSLHAGSTGYAIGAMATSQYGSANVYNSGAVYAANTSKYGMATGLAANAIQGDATIANSGSVFSSSSGRAGYGALAVSNTGDAGVTNAGDVQVATGPFGVGFGLVGRSYYGEASIANSGSILVQAKYGYGALAASDAGDASVHNGATGGISVYAMGLGSGLAARSGYGDAFASNDGDVYVYSGRTAIGVRASSDYQGDATVGNTGSVVATSGEGSAMGLLVTSGDGLASADNHGSLQAYAGYGSALGVLAAGNGVSVSNDGSIQADTYGGSAFGVYVASYGASASISNGGAISAHAAYGEGLAIGVAAYGGGPLDIHNAGTISATADGASGQAIGLYAAAYGALHVDNAGLITASQADYAVAVSLNSATVSVLSNTGTIRTDAALEGRVAVRGGDGVEQVLNYGQIDGALVLNGGDDVVFNGAGGVWTVGNHATDFGDGDDTLATGTGGLVDLTNASIAFGAGDDAIVNGGTLLLDNGAIYLGDSSAAGNSFSNLGTLRVFGDSLIDMGAGPATALVASTNPLALVNSGVIDFVDGATDDVLTINGDLGGNGALRIDLRPLAGTSDLLYVDGDIADGAVQTVDVDLGGAPTSALLGSVTQFAHVSGDSASGSFVGGRVLGWNAGDFINLQVSVSSQIDASGAAADVFSVGVAAAGLTDPGTLAASVAPGAQSLVNAQVGTWRQRMGVQPGKGAVGLSPWLRMFSDAGDVKPGHVASNFGAGGNFDFQQSNSGWEVGLNVRPGDRLNFGVLAAKSEGHQHLKDGAGTDYLDGRTFGLYATWIADRFYVDASMRWIGFDADLRAGGIRQGTSGEADAFNIEAGFDAWTVGGLNLQPQVQYTRTRVGDIRPLRGDAATFHADTADSSRARLGLSASRTIASGGWTWTPYGSLNAVREFNGEYAYDVNNDFFGSTSTKGTSALVELGVGARKDGLSVTGGVNWTDGGALNGVLGGQLVVRYNW